MYICIISTTKEFTMKKCLSTIAFFRHVKKKFLYCVLVAIARRVGVN